MLSISQGVDYRRDAPGDRHGPLHTDGPSIEMTATEDGGTEHLPVLRFQENHRAIGSSRLGRRITHASARSIAVIGTQ